MSETDKTPDRDVTVAATLGPLAMDARLILSPPDMANIVAIADLVATLDIVATLEAAGRHVRAYSPDTMRAAIADLDRRSYPPPAEKVEDFRLSVFEVLAGALSLHPYEFVTVGPDLARLARQAQELAGLPKAPKKRGRPRREEPAIVPQQTWPEFEAVIFGVVRDGKTGELWLDAPGEVALTHKRPGSSLSLRLGASAVDDPQKDYWPLHATSYADLRDKLAEGAGPRTAYLLNYTLARASKEPGRVPMPIDELVSVSGPRPRSEADRRKRRREAWEALRLFAHIGVYGRRKAYRPRKGEPDMLATVGPLIAFLEVADKEGQLSLDGSEPPREVTYAAGPWLERMTAADPSLLPYFGDVLALARQSDAQPRYVWMKALAWTLNQRWRQGAKLATEKRQGYDKDGNAKPTKLQTRDFTRRDLLDYLNPAPHYADLLAGSDPRRAVDLWNEAIALLRQEGIIGAASADYVEHGPAPWRKPKEWPSGKPFKPQGWQEAWIAQKLTIRPGPVGQAALRDVKTALAKTPKPKGPLN